VVAPFIGAVDVSVGAVVVVSVGAVVVVVDTGLFWFA
jgi:hypothetical protein